MTGSAAAVVVVTAVGETVAGADGLTDLVFVGVGDMVGDLLGRLDGDFDAVGDFDGVRLGVGLFDLS